MTYDQLRRRYDKVAGRFAGAARMLCPVRAQEGHNILQDLRPTMEVLGFSNSYDPQSDVYRKTVAFAHDCLGELERIMSTPAMPFTFVDETRHAP